MSQYTAKMLETGYLLTPRSIYIEELTKLKHYFAIHILTLVLSKALDRFIYLGPYSQQVTLRQLLSLWG